MNESESIPKSLVILHLPDSKARMVMVYGRSGKRYTFVAHAAAGGRPARVYTDEATFLEEEGDLRRNLRSSLAVCTLLGEKDALERARGAVREIVAGKKHVGTARTREALQAVMEELKAGLAVVDGSGNAEALVKREGDGDAADAEGADGADGAEVKENDETMIASKGVEESEGDDLMGADAEQVGEERREWRKAELQGMGIAELRGLARKHGVPALRRDEMVTGILKKQKEGAV